MNRFATTFFILLFTLAAASTAFATTYYSKFGTGFVYDLSHWTTLPNGTGSNPSDFTSGDTFVIQSGHLYQTSGNNWTVSGAGAKLIIDPTGILSLSLPSTVTVPECFVANTGQLFIQSTGVLTIGNGNAGGYDLVVEGSLENQGVLNYNAGGTGIISSGGQYHHEIDGGTIPVFTWAPYSKANIDGIVNATIMSGLNQSFWELIWGSSSQQSVFQCNSQLSNVHILTVVTTGTGSLVLFNTSSNLDLSGFVQWAGTVNFATTPAVNPTITFKGDSVFRQIGAGSLLCTGAGSTGTLRFDSGMTGVEIYGTIGAGVKYQLLSGAWVEMQNNIPVPTEFRIDANATLDPSVNQFMLSGAGDFILNSGGTLRVSHINGITTSPTLSGGIQVTGSRIYNSGANYVYLNAASVTGNGLPATVGKFGAVGCFLSLSNSLTVTDSFTVISATVDIGSDSLTLLGGVSSDLSGKITSAGNGTVSYLKTSGGQNILTNLSQYGNLTFNNYSKSLPSGTLFISNVFSPGSANPVVHASNIININGTGTQPIPGFRYAGLNISKSAGTAVFPNVSTDTVHISGAFTAGFSPTYDLTGSTVEFNSSTVSQYTGHLDYHNLVLRNTYQKVAIGAFITVNGLLDIGGQGLSLGATNNDNASEVIVRAGAVVDFFHPSAILTVTDGNGSGYDLIVDGTIDNSGTLQYGGGATGLMNGTYMDNHDGGTIPEFTWGNGSTAVILGIQTATTLSGLNQSFYHLTYNSSGQSSALNFNSQLTNVAGTFDIQNTGTGSIVLFDTDSKLTVGKFNLFSGTVNLSVSESAQDTIEITGSNSPNEFANPFGSLTITGGSGAHGVLHFIGAVQTAYISGAISSDIEILVSKKLSFPSITNFDGPFIVESGGILNKSTLIGSGSFELKAGGTIVIADAAGITESGATGDIRMSGSRTFSPGGRYIYENTILQNTGDGLPSVVSVLSVKNSVGVTLNRSVAVADTLFFDDQTGLLYVNTDTLSIGGTTAGYVENLNAGNGTVIYSSTADGQGVIPTTYFNLLFSDHSKNLNAGTYTVENLFDPGTVIDHAIASGSTFDFFGTTSLSVPPLRYGNLTISGNRSTNVVTFSNTDSTYISGALTLNAAFPGGGGYQTAGSKLVFNGTGAQTLPDLDFGTLVVSKPTGTLSASANISVKDNLALLYGTLDDNGFIVTVNGNIEGSFGQHITGSEGGKLLLSGGTAPHGISGATLGVVELDDVYGASVTSAPNVAVMNLMNGTLDISAGLIIRSGGKLDGNGGGITNTGYVNFFGTGTVINSFIFNNVTLNGAVNFEAGSTIEGTLQLNNGGSVAGNALTYANGSTLLYNSGGIFGRNLEWSSLSGPGYPFNVVIQNNTTLDLGANGGTGTAWTIGNDLTIVNGSSLTMNGDGNEMASPLVVLRNVTNDGNIALSSLAGGDLQVRKDYLQNDNGSITSNAAAMIMNGNTHQNISRIANYGYISVDSLIIDNSLDTVMTNNLVLSINKGLVLQNGIFRTESIESGGPTTITAVSGNFADVPNSITFYGPAEISGDVLFRDLNLHGATGFGTGSTVSGILELLSGSSVVNDPPTYANGSTLKYYTGGVFSRGLEWSATTGQGYPYHVDIRNNTTLKLGANFGMSTPRSMAGSLYIQSGSTLTMNAIETGMSEALSVAGNITNDGSLILSIDPGGDLNVGGNWSGTGSFNSYDRLVTFNGSGQTLTGPTMFTDLTIGGSGNTLTLNNNITVNGILDLTDGYVVTGADTLTVSSTGSISLTSGYVKGNLRKEFPASDGDFWFEIGDGSQYVPVYISLTSVTTPGFLTVSSSTTGPDLTGSNIDPLKNLNRFWTIGNEGVTFSQSMVSFYYNPAEVDGGADYNTFVIKRHDGIQWNTVSRTGLGDGRFDAEPFTDFGTFAYGALVTNDITASVMTSGGSISPAGITAVSYDGNQSYSITPDVGFTVDHVDVDAANLGALLSYDFLNVIAPHTIEAYFTPVVCTLSVNIYGFGMSSPGTTQINYGTDQRFFFTPDPGYHIDSVLVDYVKTDSLASYTVINATSSKSIDVYFSPNYSVTFRVDMRPAIQHGKFVPSTDSVILRGSIAPLLWTGTSYLLTDGNNDSIYTLTTDLYAIDSLFYKYVLIHRGLEMWERETPVNQNRVYVLTGSETLPVDSFDDLPAYTRVFGTYASDASSEVILHLDEDPSSGPTNHTPIGFAVFDHSLKGNNGYRNAMNFGPGRFGSAVSPNDTNLVVKIEDDAMLHSSAFTIEGWFNFDSNTGNKVLLAKTVGSGTNNSYIIYYTNGGLFAAIGNAAAMGPILGAPFTPTVGKWYHIAYSFDDNTNVHSLYVNGLLAASGANVVPIGYDNHPVVIGGEHENEVLSNFFDGKVDEVRVSSSLRNPSEFNLQLPPANITATAADTVVSLAWSAGGGTVPASRYRIYRGADSTSMTLVDSSYTTGFTETLPNGPAVYYYRAVTVDSTGFESMKSFAAADTVFDVLPPAAPVNIAALAQDSQVQVTWSPTAATDFKKYYIYGGTVPNPSSLIDSTSVIDDTVKIYSGLTNYTPYYYRVTVADTNGNISGFSGDASGMPFDQTPPAALTSLTAVPHDGSIDLSWSVSGAPDFMKYYVYGGPTPNPITRIDSLFLSNLNSTTISGLTNYTNYYFRVTAMDLNGNESNYSNEVSETPVDLTPPAAPQNLTAVVHDGQLDLHWNPNAEGDFGKYYVFFDINPNPTNRLDSTSADVNDTVRTLYGLTNYQPYHIRIAAVDQHGNVGPYSSEITATTVDQTPPAFVQYPVAVSGNHQVVLHWNPNSESDFSKYYIYTGLTSSPTTLIDSAIAGVNDTSKTITGLMNGTQYYFRLRTVDTSGNISAYSIDVFATPADVTPPSAPQNLTASAGDAQTTIHWNPNGESDFAKYYIYRGTSPNPTTAFDSTSIITDTLKTYSGLTNYQHYYFRIAAADSTGNISGYSNEVQTTPYDLTALLAPQSVAAVAGDGQVTLHWDENVEGDFKRYVIFAGTTPNPVTRYDSTTIILDTLKIYTGLTNYQTYYFRIVSEDTSGNISPFSNEVSVMPVDLTPPAAPHQLAAVAGDGQVTIHWNPNSETDFKKYYIYQGTSPNPTMLFDSGSTVIDTIKTYEGMTNNQTVYFRIAARDTSGNVGPYSNEVAVTPYDQTVPADPSALIARIGNGQLQLQWYGVSDNDFMRYRIYAGLSSNPSTVMDSTHAGDKFDTYVVLKGLTNGMQYYVRITAVDSTGNESSFSNEVSGIPSLFTELKELNPDSNTVVLLHMNESTLGLVEDASGWNNHGTAFSGSSVNPSGRFGWGRSYDGSGSATVDIPASPSVTFGAGDFTAEMFFKTSNTDATQRLFFRFNGSSNKSWTVNLGFGAPLGVLNFEGLGTPSINGSTLLNDGRWHHIAAVRNGNTVHLYADGRLEGSGPVIMPDTAGGSLFVGGNNFNPTGMMDEVRVSNIARNPFSFNLQLAPVNLAATAAGTNVNLTWANGGGLAPLRRYYIYRGTDSTSMTAIDSTVNLNYSDAGLASSTEYFYRITAKDSSGFEGARSFAAAAVTADMDPPAIPQNLLSAAGDGAVTLHWNPNTESDLAKYYIYAGTAIYPTTIVDSTCGGLNDTLKTITGLTNDQQYYFRVTAVDTNGNISGYSDQIGAMPKDITPPAVPAGFYALVNNGLITLKWKQNHEPDLKKYRIYYHPNLGTNVPLDSTVTGADTSKSFGGFAYGATHFFSVSSVDTLGNESPYSIEDAVTLVNEPGSALQFDGVDDYAYTTNAKLPQGNAPRTIEAWFKTVSTGVMNIVSWGSANGNQRASLLVHGGLIKYVGQFNDLFGTIPVNDGQWHHVAVAYDGTLLSLYVDGKLDISSAMSSFSTTGYGLLLGRTPMDHISGEFFTGEIDELRIWDRALTLSELQSAKDKTIHGDESGLVSYYRLDESNGTVAFDGSVVGSNFIYNDTPLQIPSGAMFPAAPLNLTATAGEQNVTLRWSPVSHSDFAKYYIYASLLAGPNVRYDSVMSITDTMKVLGGLNNYTTYHFRVTAADSTGNISDYSNEVTAMPSDHTAPSAPTALSVTDSIASYFTIAWNMNTETDIAKYYIYRDSVPNPTTLVDSTVNVVDTVRAFTTLTIGTPYYFRVAAVDTSNNISALSNTATAVPYMIHPINSYAYGNGSITPGGTNYVNHGDSLQFTIHADTKNHIDSIAIDPNIVMVEQRAINGVEAKDLKRQTKRLAALEQMMDPLTIVGTGNDDTLQTYTFQNVTAGHSIKAYFSKNSFVVNAIVHGSGTVTPSGSTTVFIGDTLQYCITADQYNHIDSLMVDGVKVDSTFNYTFGNISGGHTIEAYFSPNVFDHFVVVAPSRGPIDPQTAGTPFSIVTTAVDAFGNPVDNFTGNVWFSSTDTTMSVLGGNYSIPFTAGQHGPQSVTMFRAGLQTISVIDSVSGKIGTSDPFSVNAAGLHHFAVTDTCGQAVPDQVENRPFTVKITALDIFNNIQSDYTGSVEVSVSDAVVSQGAGNTPNLTGGILSAYIMQIENQGSFQIIAGDNIAEKNGASNGFFVVSDTNLIYSTSPHGDILPLGAVPVRYGDTAVFSFNPDPGHHFDSLHVDGIRVMDSTSRYTFVNVTTTHSIDAYYSVNLNIPPMFTAILSDTAIARFDTLHFTYHGSDPDSGILRYALVSGPAGTSIDSVTGHLMFAPDVNANGQYTVVVKIYDDSLAEVFDTVKVRVNIYGDVSGNGTITAFDGAMVLQYVVSAATFTPLQLKVGDVSGSGALSSLDASYILQRAVGLISSFPGGLGKQERAEAVLSAFSFRIQKSAKQDEFDLFVSVNKASNVYGIAMELGFDSSVVSPVMMAKTEVTDSMSLAYRFPDGTANMALAGITPLASAGDIIKFTFRLKVPNYPKNAVLFTMKKFILNETDHTDDIGGITLNVHDLAQLPTIYKLEQNYPNPFNPSTTINYQLPEDGSVKIVIYNMLGQVVRTLVNEVQSAGYYSMVWNGSDESDRKVSTGVYIYRIEAYGPQNKRFTEVKKMLMIK